jgi:ABC-type Fe3+-hydroxamate transport system substrate-binding protein
VLATASALALAFSAPRVTAAPAASAATAAPAKRVVSLNPSLTAMLLALGARDALVGVDSFSQRQEPATAGLPTVGGLYNPSVEAVVALAPDLVVFVPSAEQRDFQRTLEGLGLPVLALGPVGFEDVLAAIATLGARVGREAEARARIDAIRAARRAVEARAAGRPRPRTLLVLQRDPLYVVGRGSFADEMSCKKQGGCIYQSWAPKGCVAKNGTNPLENYTACGDYTPPPVSTSNHHHPEALQAYCLYKLGCSWRDRDGKVTPATGF